MPFKEHPRARTRLFFLARVAMASNGVRERGVSRDLHTARAAYDVGDIELSRKAHEAKAYSSDEHHAG